MPVTTTVTTTRNQRRQAARRPVIVTKVKKVNIRRGRKPPRRVTAPLSKGISAAGCDDNGKEFIICSIDPFGSDSARVPDGNGGMSTHIKYTSACSFTVRSGATTACVAAFPNLPGGLIAVDGAFTLPDRTGALQSVNVTPNGGGVIIPFPDLFQSATANPAYGNIGNITRCRVVSYGLEIKPVGAILNQGGVYCTARFPTNITDYATPVHIGGGVYAAQNLGSADGCMLEKGLAMIPSSYSQLQAYPGVKMCSGTESCRLVGTPAAYQYSPMENGTDQINASMLKTDMVIFHNGPVNLNYDSTNDVVGGVNVSGAASGYVSTSMYGLASDLGSYSSFWYDRNCDGLVWAAQDLSANMAFEARFHLCLEFQVSHTSSIYRPFIAQAPRADPQALAIVDEVHRKMPPSIPAPDSNSNWWSNITSAVTGVGDLVASLDIPVVSQVGALASRFAKMFG